MASILTSTINTNASPHAVWGALTDFAARPDWNPFMDRSEGTSKK